MMTYSIEGLPREQFTPFFIMSDTELAEHNALRVTTTGPGYPCRISLKDANPGERLILLNYTSHDVATPYRSAYAIYVRENGIKMTPMVDQIPPVFETRTLGLRAFDAAGMLTNAALVMPGEADSRIRELFADDDIAYIHAHNAAYGCFVARIDRSV
jgi:Protein of unknown function (DUF1203)